MQLAKNESGTENNKLSFLFYMELTNEMLVQAEFVNC